MLNRAFLATPTNAAFTTFRIGTGTTSPSEANTNLETGLTAWGSGGETYKAFDSTPVPSTTDKTIPVQCTVGTTEGNASTITEIGVFNADGTPKMAFRITHDGIVKTSSRQIIYTLKAGVV